MTIEVVHRPCAPAQACPRAAGLQGGAAARLLPDPASAEASLAASNLAKLYAVMMQIRDAHARESKGKIESDRAERDLAEREHKEALERAKKAAEEGGFFDWLSEDIGLAGAVGLVTFNYALVAADIAAHKLDLVDNLEVDVVDLGAVVTGRVDVLAADILLRKTDLAPPEARELLEKVGIPRDAPGISDEDVKPVAKKLLLANLFVVGVTASVLSGGSTAGICVALAGVALSTAGGYVAEEKVLDGVFGKGSSRWIGLGMQITGALASGMSGLAPGAAAVSGSTRVAATAIQGGTTALKGTDKVVTAVHEHERDDANIAAESARLRLARLDRILDMVIEATKELQQSHRKTGDLIQSCLKTIDDTNLALAGGVRA